MLRKSVGEKRREQDRKTKHYNSGRPRERIRFCECEMLQNSRNGVTLVFMGISEHRMISGDKVRERGEESANRKDVKCLRTINKMNTGDTKKKHRQQQQHCYVVGVRCT